MSEQTDIQQQKDFYDQYWQELKPISSYKAYRTKWIIDALLKVRKNNTEQIQLLDLGCGDGRLVPLWQAMTGATAHGLELSPRAMEVAQQQYPSIYYKQGDATDTGYDNERFHIIVCQEVLEHIEQQGKLVAEATRILKTGGALILTTPNKYYFDNRTGGNYSNQPIEQILNKEELYSLLSSSFTILSYETLVYARGDKGAYRLLTNRYLLAILRRLGIENSWKQHLLKKGYGIHMAVVCRKK